MYKILLVDDEYLELEMLTNHVAWEKFGFKVIGSAKNGRDALEKVKSFHPDVVITDIKMPIMDGIEFSNQLHAMFPEVKIAFLSGYNQFEYLRSAFQVDAIDYLLKPLNFDEVASLLVTLKKKCDEEKYVESLTKPAMIEIIREFIISETEKLLSNKAAEISRLCNSYFGTTLTDPEFFIALISINEYNLLKETGTTGLATIKRCQDRIKQLEFLLNAVIVPLKEQTYLLLSKHKYFLPEEWLAVNEEEKLRITLLIQNEKISIESLPAIYKKLSELHQYQLTHFGQCQVFWVCDLEVKVAQKKIEDAIQNQTTVFTDLVHFIQQGDCERACEWLHLYFSSYPVDSSEDYLHRLTFTLFDKLYDYFILPNKKLSKQYEEKPVILNKLRIIESVSVLENTATDYILQLISKINRLQCDPSQVVVDQMKKFITENIAENLTIESFVEEFNFSPSYLRAVFKKYTGMTVLEFTTDVRLNKAVSMLQVTSFQVNQISLRVGYKNPSYFCSKFYEKFGITPIQYRNRFRT